jgi:FixJ family two-component response regulator
MRDSLPIFKPYTTARTESTPRFLVVDDEEPIRKELLDMFEDEGFDAVEAPGADSALEMLDRDPSIGVIFTDLRMPGMSGMEFVEKLSTRYDGERPMAVVVITGHGGMDDAVNALQQGVVDFITKPFLFERTSLAVKKALVSWTKQTEDKQVTRRLSATIALQGDEIDTLSHDVTEKTLKIEAENRTRSQFLRDMNLEVNAPLQYMGSVLGQMSEPASGGGEELSRWLPAFEEATAQLANHVNTVLEIADVDISGNETNLTNFHPIDVCVRATWLFSDKASARGKEILVDGDVGNANIHADRGRFLLALGYLLDNGLKHGDGGKEVVVSIRHDPLRAGWINVVVADDGPGMDRAEIIRALTPARQASCGTYPASGTVGLGLYLAKRNVELNGGSLRAKNRSSGGLEVTMRYPGAAATEAHCDAPI